MELKRKQKMEEYQVMLQQFARFLEKSKHNSTANVYSTMRIALDTEVKSEFEDETLL